MPACTRNAVAILTDLFAADDSEATARRTGLVQRKSKLTGQRFRALGTCGAWREAQTTRAPWAAKITQLCQPGAVSPEAIHQRMNKKAMAFLQEMMRQALAKVQGLEQVGDDGLFPAFTKVYSADSTGFELPEERHKTFPGTGGSATQAGAKMPAGGDYPRSGCGHFALTPWNIPDQRYIAHVITLAAKNVLFIVDVGYCKVRALASMATAGAYLCCRFQPQTNLDDAVAGHGCPVKLAACLTTVEPQLPLLENVVLIGAQAWVVSRLMAVRMPEAIVNARRSIARKNAKQKGYTPSPSHLAL